PRHARHFSRLAIVKELRPKGREDGRPFGRSSKQTVRPCGRPSGVSGGPPGIRPVAGSHGRRPKAPAIAIRNRPSALPLPGPLFPAGFALPPPRRTCKPAPWRSVLRPLHRATLAPRRGPVPPRTTTVMIGVPAGGTGGMVREGDGEGDKSVNGEW